MGSPNLDPTLGSKSKPHDLLLCQDKAAVCPTTGTLKETGVPPSTLRPCKGMQGYAYMHTCIHAYIHACMHAHTYIHACIYACMHACMHACIHTYIHTLIIYMYMYMYICICVYMYMCISVHMYICMYVYMYICIHTLCLNSDSELCGAITGID